MPKQIAMVGEGSTGGRPLIQNSITGFCSIVCWFLQHHMRAHSSSCCAGAVVAAATLGGGVTVAAALSSGRLLIHTLADAAPSSGSEAEQLHYALEADVALPDAPTCPRRAQQHAVTLLRCRLRWQARHRPLDSILY